MPFWYRRQSFKMRDYENDSIFNTPPPNVSSKAPLTNELDLPFFNSPLKLPSSDQNQNHITEPLLNRMNGPSAKKIIPNVLCSNDVWVPRNVKWTKKIGKVFFFFFWYLAHLVLQRFNCFLVIFVRLVKKMLVAMNKNHIIVTLLKMRIPLLIDSCPRPVFSNEAIDNSVYLLWKSTYFLNYSYKSGYKLLSFHYLCVLFLAIFIMFRFSKFKLGYLLIYFPASWTNLSMPWGPL